MSAIDFSDPVIIAALTDALTQAGVDGLEISAPAGHLRIVISREEGVQSAPKGTIQPMPAVTVKAPMAGYLCTSHPAAPVGAETLPRTVSSNDVIGFIRIGPVLLPVPAGHSGSLTKRLANADTLVGFGDPLFEIEPAS